MSWEDRERESERCPGCDVKAGCFCMNCAVCGDAFRKAGRLSQQTTCAKHRCLECLGEGSFVTYPHNDITTWTEVRTPCKACKGTGRSS